MFLPRVLRGRKLLVASIGVATVTYATASCNGQSSGNLVPPPGASDGGITNPPTSGNLMPPAEHDASTEAGPVQSGDADAGDADAGDSNDAQGG